MKLSPRQLADAIGVSESSLKRWADAGKLAVSRTEGGHRRITLTEAVRFIRDTGATVIRPDLLGLAAPARARRSSGTREKNASAASATLVPRFLGGESMASLGDELVLPAIAAIEQSWDREPRIELAARAAADAWSQAIAAVRGMCVIAPGAPLALGGGPPLRSTLVAAVLASEGLRVIDLGAHVGAAVLRAATAAHEPAITWSVDAAIVDVGGYRVRTMAELAAYARGLVSRRA